MRYDSCDINTNMLLNKTDNILNDCNDIELDADTSEIIVFIVGYFSDKASQK